MSTSKKEHKDVEAPRNAIDVSTFKKGDTIKFKSGKFACVTETSRQKRTFANPPCYLVSFRDNADVSSHWNYELDGTWFSNYGNESLHTIIEHFPKPPENPETANDPVAHPAHYTSHPSGIECIQVTQHMNFNLGNVVKYVWRNGLKDSDNNIQDLKKAQWYLDNEIERLEKQQNDN